MHEGPQRIAKSAGPQAGTDEPLQAGMIVSNEPGYYKAGAFGIRIENLVLVRVADIDGAEADFLELENLTWAPLEPRLIDTGLLSASEITWVNEYHAEVSKIIGAQLEGDDKAWLESVCQPIG